MSLKYLLIVSFIPWCMNLIPASAMACGMLYFDAYGMKKKHCGNTESPKKRDLWSGVANHVSEDQSWSVLKIKAAHTNQIDILAGHKTIRAGDQNIMTIALVIDENGNPAPDNEVTNFRTVFYDNPSSAVSENIKGLSVWFMDEQRKAATGYISAETNSLQSKRSDFNVVSAEVTEIEIQPPQSLELAPKNQIKLTAINIQDRFGNDKEDGALVRFQSIAPNGARSFAQGIISNKSATAFPFNDATQAPSKWTAHIGAGVSQPVTLNSKQQELLPEVNIAIEQKIDTGTMTVKAGPFRTLAGHRVIDGTPIQFFWHDFKNGRKITNETEGHMVDGWAKAIMPMPANQQIITVEAHLLDVRLAASINMNTQSGEHVTTVEMKPQFFANLRGSIS